MSSVLPILSRNKAYPSLLSRDYQIIDYQTPRRAQSDQYEIKADLCLNRAETWIAAIYVRIDPNYIAANALRVIVWDSNNFSGNPADPATIVPDVRTIDSPDLAPGDFWFWEPPMPVMRATNEEMFGLMYVGLGYHLENGYRLQVVDTVTYQPIELAARIVTTFVGCPVS